MKINWYGSRKSINVFHFCVLIDPVEQSTISFFIGGINKMRYMMLNQNQLWIKTIRISCFLIRFILIHCSFIVSKNNGREPKTNLPLFLVTVKLHSSNLARGKFSLQISNRIGSIVYTIYNDAKVESASHFSISSNGKVKSHELCSWCAKITLS